MNSDVLVKNTWYIVGLSQDFQKDVLQGQVVAERPIVMWRTKSPNLNGSATIGDGRFFV